MFEPRRVAILTRQPEDNARLGARLRASGAEVIELPCVRTRRLDDGVLAEAIRHMADEDWLVVTSRAGAEAVARAARPRCRVAAVGRATAGRLERHGIPVAFLPRVPSGAALARELPPARAALLARSDRALADLPGILRARGFAVREVVAYRTVASADGEVTRARSVLADARCDVAVFVASPSAVGAFGDVTGDLAARATFRVMGEATTAAVRARWPLARVERYEEADADVTH